MRVLITGAAGFLGLALVRRFAQAGHWVAAIDRAPEADFVPRSDTLRDHLTYQSIDVSARPDVLVLQDDVDAVVHAAALTPSAEQVQRDPERLLDVNLGGTVNVLAWMRRAHPGRRFLYVSSSAVFSASRGGTLDEADADGGTSLYSAAKLTAEYVVQRYGLMFGLETAAVRPTSLYGPGERVRGSRPGVTQIWELAHAGRRGTPVRITDQDARNDWLYVDDAADAIYRLICAKQMPQRIFNLSSATPVRFRTVVGVARSVFPLIVDPDAETVVSGEPDRGSIISNDRLRAAIDWAPRSLADGMVAYAGALESDNLAGVASGG